MTPILTPNLKVEAQEKSISTNKATADVTIVLLDENDNSPQFTASKYEGKVFSNQSAGMQVVKVTNHCFVESFKCFHNNQCFSTFSEIVEP